jgi:hypothetical protein
MEDGQIGLGIQLVVLLVVEEYNWIQEAVQIHHQLKLGCLVLAIGTMREFAMKTIVYVSSCNLILD